MSREKKARGGGERERGEERMKNTAVCGDEKITPVGAFSRDAVTG